MKRKYSLSLAACSVLAIWSFSGCGSDSSSTTSATSSGTLSLNPKLAGVTYTCGTTENTTDENGTYYYHDGETCTFSIGGIELSTSNPSSSITIAQLTEENEDVSSEAFSAYIMTLAGESDPDNLPTKIDMSLLKSKIPSGIKKSDLASMDSIESILSADSTLKDNYEAVKANQYQLASKFANKVLLSFDEIATPTTEATKNTQQVSTTAYVNGEAQTIGYKSIMKTGDSDNGEIFGLVKDYQDKTITFDDNSPYICNGTNSGVGSGLDYSSFLNVNDKLYMVSQFECQIGAMYMTELEQSDSGALTPKDGTLKFISQKDEFGGFVHCAGQKTPWESHLGSEEYENDARAVEEDANTTTGLTGNTYYDETAKFWGDDATKMSPYYYGWTPEVSIDSDGEAVYKKHYAMGRFSHELSYVMPDKKTVYMSDDGTNVGFFMYIADTAEDLSSGTLYGAKWNQISDEDAGSANITWVNLGHATNSEIKSYLDSDNNVSSNDSLVFSDMFDAVDGNTTTGTCPSTYTAINTTTGFECLKLKDGMEKAASRLETRRYAALKGATTEFRKEEGITFDKVSGKLYVSMSEVRKGMEDNSSSDFGGNNHIKLNSNACGAVYALDIDTNSSTDTSSSDINSSYVVKNMYSIIEGTPMSYDESNSIYAGNTCDVNGISNPDNITFLENSDILMIGEDTSSHENNVVWALNTKTYELTRVFTTPLGAETTSPFWYSDLSNGYGYLSVVTQHPDSDTTDAGESSIGYVGPFKNLTTLKAATTINSMKKIATYKTSKEGGSEIVAYDKSSKKMFTTNGADNTLDITPIGTDGSVGTTTAISLSTYGAGVQSVAVYNGKVAVAVGSSNKVTTKGKVVIFDTAGTLLSQTTVGYLPDMVTFNEDGTKVIVANEGEPDASDGNYTDVAGSIGVITVASADANDNANGYAEVTFANATLSDASDGTAVRLGGTESNSSALDIEPEYIAVSGDYAYVTLQENNAIAKVDISGDEPTLSFVKSLGAKDYSSKNTIDIEEEGEVLMKNYAGLYGLYMPDSIVSYTSDEKTYLVTANEGDGREYCSDADPDCDEPVFIDEAKIKKLDLDSAIADDYENENDLKVVTDMGDTDGDGDYDKLYAFGARSFSIWDDNGSLVFDSGDQISKLIAKFEPELFNLDDDEKDGRSGNKGGEPEALAIGELNGKIYAFVGLERQSVIVIFDITDPSNGKFVKYYDTKDEGDISPEGMKFISKDDSPTGTALLMVAFEVSGSTAIYEIK